MSLFLSIVLPRCSTPSYYYYLVPPPISPSHFFSSLFLSDVAYSERLMKNESYINITPVEQSCDD